MSDVYLDSEKVTFNGDEPQNVRGVIEVLTRYLQENGRLVAEARVDGVDIVNLKEEAYLKSFGRIDVVSNTEEEYLSGWVKQVSRDVSVLDRDMVSFSEEILNKPWDENTGRGKEILEGFVPILRLIEGLVFYGKQKEAEWIDELKEQLKGYRGSLNLYTSALALKDPASMSDIVALDLLPALRKTFALIEGPILAHFQRKPCDHGAPAS